MDFVIHDAGATAIGTKVLNARNRVSKCAGLCHAGVRRLLAARPYQPGGTGPATPNANSPVKAEDDFRQYDARARYASRQLLCGPWLLARRQDRRAGRE
ncbi:hypothetical protein ACTMU2_29960 [Cupriavidus basilensis]